jgi:IS30 family transposase
MCTLIWTSAVRLPGGVMRKCPWQRSRFGWGVPPSTIYRELRRNFFRDVELPNLKGYYGLNAQAMAERRRHVKRKLVRFPLVKAAVLDRLKG